VVDRPPKCGIEKEKIMETLQPGKAMTQIISPPNSPHNGEDFFCLPRYGGDAGGKGGL